MIDARLLTLGLASLAIAGAAPAEAQLAAPGTAGGGAGAQISDQGSDAISEFLGLNVIATRVLVDTASGGFRVIVSVTDKADTPRLASWMAPQPTMIDDMGNLYAATSIAGGVGICDTLKRNKASDCVYYAPTDFTRMPANTPITAVLSFAPVEGRVLQETVPLASTASLNGRIAVHNEGAAYQEAKAADVVINGLQLPK
ncbi:MAG: hypothetical protein AAF577_11655 [Pseudomonadota bacterium]